MSSPCVSSISTIQLYFSSPDHAAALARTAMYSELLPPLLQRLLGVSPLEFDSDRNTQLSAL